MLDTDSPTSSAVEQFIARWTPSSGSEISNSSSFLKELCTLLDLPQPDPATDDTENNAYVFERRVVFNNGDGTVSNRRIDLYKRGCFVLESKQGSNSPETQADPLLTPRKKRHRGTAVRGTGG